MRAKTLQTQVSTVGRYAPSPSGPLHFGSLVAAVASYLNARSVGGLWLMRIEDIDPAREVPGASDDILRALDIYGLHWDGPVLYQSERDQAYKDALESLLQHDFAFNCGCTRKQAQTGPIGREGPVYPGTCRNGLPAGKQARSVRLRVDAGDVEFIDQLYGCVRQNLSADVGDFVLRRADHCFAYQLAVVVDDAYQGVTEVARGADLLYSTPRQILLQRCLGFSTPDYCHFPLVLDDGGEKLSKHSHAPALDLARPQVALYRALEFLGQQPPSDLRGARPAEILEWAIPHWQLRAVPARSD